MATPSKSGDCFIISRSHVRLLREIEDLLGETNMCRIRSSCFGKLFDISPEIKFDPHVYRNLLRSMEISSEGRGSLSFRVSSRSIEFAVEDFALVCGLACDAADPNIPLTSSFHNIIFGGKPNLVFADIGKKFREECSKDRGSQTSLRLALLFIVHGLLLIDDPILNTIDLRYMHLVDDLDAFLSHPWGSAAYEFLVQQTHRCRRTLEEKLFVRGNDGTEVIINVPGFTAPLMCWFYEVFPMVAVKCGTKLFERVHVVPRLLHWKSHSHTDFEEIERMFSDEGRTYPVPMSLSEDEKIMLRNLKKQSPQSFYRSKIRARRLDFDECTPNATKKNRSCETPAVSTSNPRSYDEYAEEGGNNDLQIVVQDLVNRLNDRDLKDSNILERLERVERFMERFSKNVKKSAKKTSQKKSSTIANLKTGNHGDIASTSPLKFDPCDSGYSHAEVQNFLLWQQAAKVLEPVGGASNRL